MMLLPVILLTLGSTLCHGEMKKISQLEFQGKNCEHSGRVICHRDIRSRFVSDVAFICNDGEFEEILMNEVTYCEGDRISQPKWWLRMTCKNGEVNTQSRLFP